MHVADGKDVNQKTDKRHEERVDPTEPVHRQTEVGAKLSDLNPGPEMIENRLRRSKRAGCFEGQVKSDNRRNTYSSAGYAANKLLVAHPATDEPIDRRAGQRSKNDQAEKVNIHFMRVSIA